LRPSLEPQQKGLCLLEAGSPQRHLVTQDSRACTLSGPATTLNDRPKSAYLEVFRVRTCGKPETVGKADAGDRAGHTMELGKGSCTWTAPLEMAGLKSKDGNSVSFVEATSTRSSGTGTFVGDMDNGDKFFVSFHDSTTIKNGQPAGPSKGTWSYTGGTGKLKGLQGKGTYTVTVNADGTSTVAVEGDYIIAEPTPKAAKQKPPSQ
jgi:hypothetical protein